jgi:hypothetical protein
MDDTGSYIATLYDGSHHLEIMLPQQIVPPQPRWDRWDLAQALTVGSTIVSLLAAFNRKSEDLAALSLVLGLASKAVHEITPPRCEECRLRSVPSGAWWTCPQCLCIVGPRTPEAQVIPVG